VRPEPSPAVIHPERGIRVLPIAEVRLYREGLASSLAKRKGIVVVGMAASGDEALRLLASVPADIVVLDMATRGSLEIVGALTRTGSPSVKIIAFAIEGGEPEILACAEAGVAGYVHFEASMDELVTAIESVMRGELLCPPRTAAILLSRLGSLARGQLEGPGPLDLTSREREIVVLIADGLSNKEIAQQLRLEVATVKNHVHSILEKLHVTSRGQAAAHVRSANAYAPRSRLSDRR
jgi:DNA-binding NarL/FixJ family response regulator